MVALARRPKRPGQSSTRRRRAATAIAAGLACIWTGCSVKTHYEALSFFFDGVPDPNAPPPEARLREGDPALAILSTHTAYEERRCADCHGTSSRFGMSVSGFSDLDAGICVTCHEDLLGAHRQIHGPVASGECLWCHEPHESRHTYLLTKPGPALCLGCHGFELRSGPQLEPHDDLERDCLECHSGHGGDDRRFLRPPDAPDESEPPEEIDSNPPESMEERGG